jgi:hypothetical protein
VTNGNGTFGIEITIAGSVNQLFHNTSAMANGTTDLWDNNVNCDANSWVDNVFDTRNQSCIH